MVEGGGLCHPDGWGVAGSAPSLAGTRPQPQRSSCGNGKGQHCPLGGVRMESFDLGSPAQARGGSWKTAAVRLLMESHLHLLWSSSSGVTEVREGWEGSAAREAASVRACVCWHSSSACTAGRASAQVPLGRQGAGM